MPVLPRDKVFGLTTDIWWIDGDDTMPAIEPPEGRDHAILARVLQDFELTGRLPPSISRPSYNTRPAFVAPEFFIVQYIGGAFNGEQEYLEYAKYKLAIVEGGYYSRILPSPPPTISSNGVVSVTEALRACYSLTFIPRNQTPFAESAQVVLALFKE